MSNNLVTYFVVDLVATSPKNDSKLRMHNRQKLANIEEKSQGAHAPPPPLCVRAWNFDANTVRS